MSKSRSLVGIYLGDADVLTTPATQALEQRLGQLWEDGRAAWPDVELAAEILVRQVAGQRPEAGDVAAFLDTLDAGDVYLACACAQGNKAALHAFDRVILGNVPAFVARIDASPAFADEVRQILRTRLLLATDGARPRIAEYAGSGPLRSWVRVAAVRTALNLRRNQDDRPHDSIDVDTVGQLAQQPEVEVLRAQHQREFQAALRESFTHLAPEDRNILRMHFAGGLTGDRIAELLQVNRSTIVRKLARIRMEMMQETRRLLRDRLRLPAAELDSFIRIMRSGLNLSLGSLLKEG